METKFYFMYSLGTDPHLSAFLDLQPPDVFLTEVEVGMGDRNFPWIP